MIINCALQFVGRERGLLPQRAVHMSIHRHGMFWCEWLGKVCIPRHRRPCGKTTRRPDSDRLHIPCAEKVVELDCGSCSHEHWASRNCRCMQIYGVAHLVVASIPLYARRRSRNPPRVNNTPRAVFFVKYSKQVLKGAKTPSGGFRVHTTPTTRGKRRTQTARRPR
jgi:hypothetical protein